jgi:hypothetical protein
MSAEISDRPNQDPMVIVSDVVRKAQDGLSSDYEGLLHKLAVQVRTATAAEAAALYETYLTDLTQRKERATTRIREKTPLHLDFNRFEVGLIEAQERQIAKDRSATPALPASPPAPTHNSRRVRQILEQEEQPLEIVPLFAEGEEPEDFRFLPNLGIDVEHHDGEDGEAPPKPAFTFVVKNGKEEPSLQTLSLGRAVSSVTPSFVGPPAPYNTFTLDVPVAAMEGEFIPADESPPEGTSLSLVVSPPPQGVSIEDIDIEHIEMKPTHHGMKDHHAEIEENGTRRWTPQRIAEDEAKVRLALEHLTGQDLKDFLRDVLVPLNKEVLTELAARQQSNASLPPTVLATLNADLLDHADRLRGFVRTAQNTLRNTPSAPTSALDDGGSSPPPTPPSSGEGQGRASSPVMASRSRPTEERWALTEMLGRGNDLREAVTETVDFARSVKNPTSLTDILTDELLPEQADVGNELARRREAYGSEFNQTIFAEREFHLLEHAKVMSQLVSRVQEEVTSLETVAAHSHSSAHRPASIPTIAEMLDMRNAIRRGHLEGGTETELISHALSGVESALARDPSNAFYKDEMKQLLAFQAEDQRRQALENLRTEEIRSAAEKEAAATPPSFRERLTSVFSRARSSLTDSFTRATNASWNPFGQMSATSFAKFASVAALSVGIKGAADSSPSHVEEKLSQPSVAEVPAESSSTLNGIFSSTSQMLRNALSSLRAARSPQEDSYARKSEERTREPG